MSNDLRPYVDLTDVVKALALRDFPGTYAKVGSSLDDVEDNLMYLRLETLGGAGGRLNRITTMDVEHFAETYSQANTQAEAFSAYLLGYPRSVKVGERLVVLDMVVETRPPVEMPWDDSPIRRLGATYQISVRR
jgi:hypothetical protein